jgi:acetolactate synthase-1/2/3 large subunit
MRIADLIAQTLAAHGIRHAFGMPGGEVVTMLDALEAAGIAFTLARNETAAAMMAAGASAVTGAPGLLLTTLGPGLANAVNGIADAQQEQVPLLVISGIVESSVRGRYTHQILDHAALLRPLVKASFEIAAEGAAETIARALALAVRVPAGPVHIDLSPVLAAQDAPAASHPVKPPIRLHPVPAGDDPVLRAVADKIAHSRHPIILAGFEAARCGAAAAVTLLMDQQRIPVITTYKAKGLVPEDHPLSLGGAGLSPKADKVLLELIAKADLILTIGYDPIEMRVGWLDAFPATAHVIDLTAHPADHGMHRIDQQVIGPLPGTIAALNWALGKSAPPPHWAAGQAVAARTELHAAFASPAAWGPHAVFATLQAALPESATVTVDSGAHRILFSQIWQAQRPLSVLQSAGFCTMGAALPLAIGAARAGVPGPVVAIMGDGGLEMTLGELGTLRDAGLKVIVLVVQDVSLALIALKQAQAGLAPAGVAMGRTDYAALAKAFGGAGETVESVGALGAALERALAADGFSLIAAAVDAEAYRGAF